MKFVTPTPLAPLVGRTSYVWANVWAFDLEAYRQADARKDYVEAARHLIIGAKEGIFVVQALLGDAYSKGEGVTQNQKIALYWRKKAAEQGYAVAQQRVGLMYFIGQGAAKNIESAYFWLLLASVDGDADHVKYRAGIGKKLTSKQRSRVKAQASEWKPTPSASYL